MAAIIETVRDWIAGCPLVEENAILGVDRAIFSKASCFFAKRSPIGIEKSSFRP